MLMVHFRHTAVSVLCIALVFISADSFWNVLHSKRSGTQMPPSTQASAVSRNTAQFTRDEMPPDNKTFLAPDSRHESTPIEAQIYLGTSLAENLEGVIFEDVYPLSVLPGTTLQDEHPGGVVEDLYEKRVIEQKSMLEADEILESTVYQDRYEVMTLESDYVDLPPYMYDEVEPRVIPFSHPEFTQQEYLDLIDEPPD